MILQSRSPNERVIMMSSHFRRKKKKKVFLSSRPAVPSGERPSFTGRFLCPSWLTGGPPGGPLLGAFIVVTICWRQAVEVKAI